MTASGTSHFELVDGQLGYAENTVLRDVQLEVQTGECIAIVGPSGSGKSTLLRTLSTTLPPLDGRLTIDGRSPSNLSRDERRHLRGELGLVTQDLRLVPSLRAIHNVLAGGLGRQSFGASLRSFVRPRREEREDVFRILQNVGIPEKIYERTDRLSGGEAQRVAIARALYQKPKALLADEPISAVDPARARDLLTLFRDLARDLNLTLIVSLHQIELAREFFPRLVGLRDGGVAFDTQESPVSDKELASLYEIEDARPHAQ